MISSSHSSQGGFKKFIAIPKTMRHLCIHTGDPKCISSCLLNFQSCSTPTSSAQWFFTAEIVVVFSWCSQRCSVRRCPPKKVSHPCADEKQATKRNGRRMGLFNNHPGNLKTVMFFHLVPQVSFKKKTKIIREQNLVNKSWKHSVGLSEDERALNLATPWKTRGRTSASCA